VRTDILKRDVILRLMLARVNDRISYLEEMTSRYPYIADSEEYNYLIKLRADLEREIA
jgi:hypothetical protein